MAWLNDATRFLLAASTLIAESGAQDIPQSTANKQVLPLQQILSTQATKDIDFAELQAWTTFGPNAVVALRVRTRELIMIERSKNRLRVIRLATIPKELGRVTALAAIGDTVVITDVRGTRAMVSRNGELRRTPTSFRGNDPRFCGELAFIHSLTSNALLAIPRYTARESAAQPHSQAALMVVAANTSITCDTLFTYRPGPFAYALSDGATTTFQPLNDGDVVSVSGSWAFFGRRLAQKNSGRISYFIRRVHLGTRDVDSLSRYYKPIRVSIGLRDSVRTAALSALKDVPLSRSELLAALDSGLYFPEFVPPFSRLIAAPSGALLVEREIAGPVSTYDAYSSRLTFAGQIRVRRNERVVAFGYGSLWILRTGADSQEFFLYHTPTLA